MEICPIIYKSVKRIWKNEVGFKCKCFFPLLLYSIGMVGLDLYKIYCDDVICIIYSFIISQSNKSSPKSPFLGYINQTILASSVYDVS